MSGRASCRRYLTIAGLYGVAALSACDDAVDPEAAVPSLDDQPRLEVEADLRIDGHESTLLPISWLGADREGTIAVLQRQDGTIRFFDPAGNAIGTVGGLGEGPGEFQWLSIGGWKSDTLWVFDFGLRRVTLVRPPDSVVRVLPPLASASPAAADSSDLPDFPFVSPYAMYGGDSLLVSAQWGRGDPKAERFDSPQLLRISAAGVIDEVVLATPTSEGTNVRYEFGEEGVGTVAVPFAHRAHWAASSHGRRIVTVEPRTPDGEAGTVLVTMYDERGESLYSREYSYHGEPIPDAVKDSVVQHRAEQSSNPIARDLYRGEVSDLIPAVYPPVSDVMVDREGRAWLRLHRDPDTSWLVLSEDGSPIGIVQLPGDVELYEGTGDVVWGAETDELGVESVVVFSVDAAG